MFLKYVGNTPDFTYMGADFSKGPAEVDDKKGMLWLKESPMSFVQVVPAKVAPAKVLPAKVAPVKAK